MPDEPAQSTCAPVALITGAQRAFSALPRVDQSKIQM